MVPVTPVSRSAHTARSVLKMEKEKPGENSRARLSWQFLRESTASALLPTLAVKSLVKSGEGELSGCLGCGRRSLTDGQDAAVGPVDVDAALRASGSSGDDVLDLEGCWCGVLWSCEGYCRKGESTQCV